LQLALGVDPKVSEVTSPVFANSKAVADRCKDRSINTVPR